ncbi:hypothetical protein TNCV_851241 [Trichonephila clavipes]|nr:hypothetical protein TNCV_851241 [Trichonephila clavipes]
MKAPVATPRFAMSTEISVGTQSDANYAHWGILTAYWEGITLTCVAPTGQTINEDYYCRYLQCHQCPAMRLGNPCPSPCYFDLFLKLKELLWGRRFHDVSSARFTKGHSVADINIKYLTNDLQWFPNIWHNVISFADDYLEGILCHCTCKFIKN